MKEEFDVDALIERIKGKNSIEMYNAVVSECKIAENIMRRESVRSDRYFRARTYSNFVDGLAFMLHSAVIHPAGMTKEDFIKTKPLFQSLVDCGEFKPSALDCYKKYDVTA